jgi:hypothetical protein
MNPNPIKYAWSYSSINLFKQCPHKYYRIRVKKDIVEPESEAMRYGTAVHKAAEDYIKEDTPVPPQFAFMQKPLDVLKAKPGEKLCEYKMGLTRNLTPCGFFDKDVWCRGIADLVVLQEDRAWVVDYKTGKSAKYADTKQLELLSLAIFKHFPQVKKIKAGLLFLVVNDFVTREYENDEGKGKAWLQWLDATHTLETCMAVDVWNAKPNFTCKNFCPVIDCIHNGKAH